MPAPVPVPVTAGPSVTPAAASGDAPAPKKFLGFEALTWAKIVPLGLMFFCILFNYTILRDTKASFCCRDPPPTACVALAACACSPRQPSREAWNAVRFAPRARLTGGLLAAGNVRARRMCWS